MIRVKKKYSFINADQKCLFLMIFSSEYNVLVYLITKLIFHVNLLFRKIYGERERVNLDILRPMLKIKG